MLSVLARACEGLLPSGSGSGSGAGAGAASLLYGGEDIVWAFCFV